MSLEIQNLCKKIKNKEIIKNISLHINKGEIVGFLGPNGAGKTTTIKMIMGLLKIDSGSIKINGFDVSTEFESAMINVGSIVENPELYKNLTGRENLRYLANFYDDKAINNLESVIELVKMKDVIDNKVKTYSLGMRQRVGLASTLLHMPSLLILDEPTNGLDPLGIKELRDLLKTLAKKSDVGIMVSSHLLSEMELMCDRIYIIDNGIIVDERLLHNKKENDYHYGYITSNNETLIKYLKQESINYIIDEKEVKAKLEINQVVKINKYLFNNNIDIYAINRTSLTLEDEFINITSGSKNQIS